MPPPRNQQITGETMNGMGDALSGLVSFIIPAMYRKKTESLERLTSPLYTLCEVLRDIHKNVTVPFEVIVVCNETENKDFIHFIETSSHITRFCRNSENVGVPRAWNMGAQMALGEYLCFVNDDVEIGPGAVEIFARYLADNPDVGEVGPRGGLWSERGPGRRVGISGIEDADEVSGFFFMTPRKVFDAVGGFDVAYTPALMEEIDYSFRVRAAGYAARVIPHPSVVHHHVKGASSTDLPIEALGFSLCRDALTQRNRRHFAKKWGRQLRNSETIEES